MHVAHDRPGDQQPGGNRPRGWLRLALGTGALAAILVATATLGRPGPLPWQAGHASDGQANGAVAFALPAGQSQKALSPAPRIGGRAPDFTIAGLDGQPLSLTQLRGKVVLVNFWATWCDPCKQEFPLLVRAYEQRAADGLVVLGVDVQESAAEVTQFTHAFGATFPTGIDADSTVVLRYRLLGLPTSFFIDRDGVVRAVQAGPLNDNSLAKKLAAAGLAATR